MKEQPELTIYEVPTVDLVPYANNAKEHSREQVETIVNSIEDYGFNDPIAVWHNAEGDMEIVEGHGRVLAAKRMGLENVPVIYLDHLSDQQRREYVHVHNQTTLNSDMDLDILASEFDDFTGFDPERFGFGELDEVEDVADDTYTDKVDSPIYEPAGRDVDVADLVNTETMDQLIERIEEAPVPENIKEFLRLAAARHAVFDYGNIAEYYAKASPEVKELFEDSVLVIIDYEKAIEKGLVKLYDMVEDVFDGDEEQ